MDYAPLVKAIQEGNDQEANRLISKVTPILVRMLQVRMNASLQDAEDTVQIMFINVIRAIRENRIDYPERLLAYMITACRNGYMKNQGKHDYMLFSEGVEEPREEPAQLRQLIEKEKLRHYETCIESLRSDHKEFIRYWLRHPDANASDVAEHFGISVNNAWVRKHRIIKLIQDCLESKI